MIAHCVFLALRPEAETEELRSTMTGLEELRRTLPGFAGLTAGPNLDFEGKSPEFPWGFIAYFEDEAALRAYADDPTHKALGARLGALCEGGADGIVVYDLEVAG